MSSPAVLWRAREHRRGLQDPSYGLSRTAHIFSGDTWSQLHFPDRAQPVTSMVDIQLDGIAPNGVIWEVGRNTHGSALWLDNVLGVLGFAAGQGLAVPNDGVSGTTPLNHLGIATVDLVVAGGSGYSVNDLITLDGGTFSRAAVLRVLTLSTDAVATVSIEDAGVYSVTPSDPVAQDTVAPPGGSAATFNLTFALTRISPFRVVAAIIPCTGEIRVWVNDDLKIAEQAVSLSFDVGTPGNSSWAEGPGGGGIGVVSGSIQDRVPAASRVAIADATVVGDSVSFYDTQRPKNFKLA